MKIKLILLLFTITSMVANAQIGYQVALLNNVTGEPRANESVSVEVKITDGEGKTVCSETKSATTNEFGILSLSVGSNEVFNKVDWSKQPFFISATIDNVLIGKSQILSVPIAEYAKRTGQLTKELLKSRTWIFSENDEYSSSTTEITFDDKFLYVKYTDRYGNSEPEVHTYQVRYLIVGDAVLHSRGVLMLFDLDNRILEYNSKEFSF